MRLTIRHTLILVYAIVTVLVMIAGLWFVFLALAVQGSSGGDIRPLIVQCVPFHLVSPFWFHDDDWLKVWSRWEFWEMSARGCLVVVALAGVTYSWRMHRFSGREHLVLLASIALIIGTAFVALQLR